VVQRLRTPAFHAGDRGFESRRPYYPRRISRPTAAISLSREPLGASLRVAVHDAMPGVRIQQAQRHVEVVAIGVPFGGSFRGSVAIP
jgi:hypothetical protein